MVTVFGRKEEDVTKDVGKELTGSIAEALNAHKQNPELTIPEIARITKYTQRTVERSLSELKELKVIKRIGGRKKGKWQLGR